MLEWLKRHDWKSCVLQKGTQGSNPCLSASMKILFVCHGNICRSPMAEFILKALVKAKGLDDGYYIESAAVSDEEYGNLRWLQRIIPDDPQKKIHLLMSYTGSGRDVADPWYTGDFEKAFQDILEGCEAILEHSRISSR